MRSYVVRFLRGERGAITIEFVVVSAAVLGIGIGAFAQIIPNIQAAGTAVGEDIAETVEVPDL